MNSISLFFRSGEVRVPFPDSWDELTTPQLSYCLLTQTEEYPRQKLFYYLLVDGARKAKIKLPKNWELRLNLKEASLASLNALDFLFKENNLTRFPFPELRIGLRRFQGPADRMASLTVHQLELAFPLVEKFRISNEPAHLHELCAVLFLKKSDREFSPDKIQKRKKIFRKLKPDALLCVYAWMLGCFNQLPKYFTDLYPQAAADGPVKEFDYQAFTKCIHGSAGPRNGLRADIRKLNALEFIYDLNLLSAESKKMEEELKSKAK